MSIKVGDTAPEVSLQNQDGKTIHLSDYKGKKNVVLYFYPKAETPGCTKESCAFRDSFTVFTDAGAEVVGISSDTPEEQKKFATKYRLPFNLLSDLNGKTRKVFGVPTTLGLLPGRVTYIIDKKGVVRHIFNSQFNATKHVDEALKIIKELQ